MSNRLASIATRQSQTRSRDLMFIAFVALVTVISVSSVVTIITKAIEKLLG